MRSRRALGYTPTMDLSRELDVALDLARRCGAIALDYQRQGRDALEIRDKGHDQGLVTRADTELNTRLVEALHRAFPDDVIVAEESSDMVDADRRSAARCWQIDPIDGTSEYSRLESSWAIHIGLVIDGEAALGVVHEPARGRISWGVNVGPKLGSWGQRERGQPFRLQRQAVGLDELRMVSSKSHVSPKTIEVMEALQIPSKRNLRLGSTGVKTMTLAWQESDLYVHPSAGTKLWDTAAPHAVLRGAGCTLSDLLGRPLRYRGPSIGNDAGLLACGADEHSEIRDRLHALAERWLSA